MDLFKVNDEDGVSYINLERAIRFSPGRLADEIDIEFSLGQPITLKGEDAKRLQALLDDYFPD